MLVCHSLWKTINIVKKVNHFFFALKNRSIHLKMIITFLSLSFYGCLCFLLYRLNFNRIVSIYDYKSNSSDDNKIYSKKIKTKKKWTQTVYYTNRCWIQTFFFLFSPLFITHIIYSNCYGFFHFVCVCENFNSCFFSFFSIRSIHTPEIATLI